MDYKMGNVDSDVDTFADAYQRYVDAIKRK